MIAMGTAESIIFIGQIISIVLGILVLYRLSLQESR